MTIQLNIRAKLRLALVAGVSAMTVAIVASRPAIAQDTAEQSIYLLRYAKEVSQAGEVMSQSKDVMMARRRVHDRSLLIFDTQNGIAITERSGGIGIQDLQSKTGPEASYAFDYVNNVASGSDAAASNFNTIVHPLLKSSPPLGRDASWSVNTDLQSLGLKIDLAAVSLNMARRYFDNQGTPIALIEFDVPAFTYALPNGDTVVQWAHGFAVTDPGFGQIHALATQHRVSAIASDGTIRPVSVSTSLHGIDRTGEWRMQFGDAPEVQAAMARVLATRGEKSFPIAAAPRKGAGPVSVADVAARLDFVAFGLMENSPNGIGLALDALEKDDDLPDLSGLSGVLAGFDLAHPYSNEESERITQSLKKSQEMMDQMKQTGGSMELISKLVKIMKPLQSWEGEDEHTGNLTTAQLDALVAQMAADGRSAAQQKDAEIAAALTVAKLLQQSGVENGIGPRLQQKDVLEGVLPNWLLGEISSVDEAVRRAQYEQLMDEILRELELARAALEAADKSAGSGLHSLDAFVANNAFTFDSMVGIVPTDLSRWAEWLATQNMRELERLALTAGYPNLASALNDSGNILRQSQDEGYRKWALQAPSCGGYVGCGPSYLERWHMKTALVALGDILDASRDIFSSGGFSDIGISGLNLSYLLRDHALEDGDVVRVRISQFGRNIYEGEISLTNLGNTFNKGLGRGVASLEIFAVNEGYSSPNTAQITVDNVVRGQGTQTYSLRTGETATLRIEAGATVNPGAP